jgi:hypothetical protein
VLRNRQLPLDMPLKLEIEVPSNSTLTRGSLRNPQDGSCTPGVSEDSYCRPFPISVDAELVICFSGRDEVYATIVVGGGGLNGSNRLTIRFIRDAALVANAQLRIGKSRRTCNDNGRLIASYFWIDLLFRRESRSGRKFY